MCYVVNLDSNDQCYAMTDRWISAEEAAERLGVTQATLYAYVSRGMVRSEPGKQGRKRLYRADDIRGLREKRSTGRQPASIARRAMNFGTPILASGLTLIADHRVYYRGRDAVALSRTASLEEVARLLWRCESDPFSAGNLPPETPAMRQARKLAAGLPPLERCRVLLPFAAAADDRAWAADNSIRQDTGARALRLVAAGAVGVAANADPVGAVLARAWNVRGRHRDLLRQALVLCADHELNVSGFTARVVASSGATIYDSVLSGLSALNGPRHGGQTLRVGALLDSLAGERDLRRAIAGMVRNGQRIPGVGHFLYPEGDPRGLALLTSVARLFPDHPVTAFARKVAAAVEAVIDRKPNIDFALGTIERVLALPPGSAIAIFLVGRTVGWIAHHLEQSETETLIRPRAQYVGPAPEPDES